MELGVWAAVAAVLLFASGLALGVLLGGTRLGSHRARQLERDLREERERADRYRESVAKHFADTSDRFRDLTREYTALYAHLAEGARELCPERVPELGRGYAQSLPGELEELAGPDASEKPESAAG